MQKLRLATYTKYVVINRGISFYNLSIMVYYTSKSGINNHIIREILHDIGLRDDIIHRFINHYLQHRIDHYSDGDPEYWLTVYINQYFNGIKPLDNRGYESIYQDNIIQSTTEFDKHFKNTYT